MKEITTRVAFAVEDRIVVADPCYIDENDTLESLGSLGVVLDGCKGTWVAEIKMDGGRVGVLRATKHDESAFTSSWEHVGDNGVDSGQMFIGCVSGFPLNYDAVLAHYQPNGPCPTGEWEDKDFFGHGEGAISSTGYGDGSYPVYVKRNTRGEPVAIEVRFLEDSDEEEESAG
jgi:hypothetical protein